MTQLSVLHVSTGLGAGGAERMLVNLVKASPHVRHSVLVLSNKDFFAEELRSLGAFVMFSSSRSPLGLLSDCRRAATRVSADVVQSWMFHADLVATLALFFRYRGRHAWSLQAGILPAENFRLSVRAIRRALAALSWVSERDVVACSNATAEEARRVGYRADRITVIPNAVDIFEFSPSVVERDSRRRITFVCPARWHPMKGHRFLLNAWATLPPGHDARLILVGSGCDGRNSELVAVVDALALNESVELLGERRDLPDVLRSADCIVLSSISGEGLPLALCEGMACGLPAVVTDVGSMADVVGSCGKVVPPSRPDLLAVALAEVISMGDWARTAMGSRARARIVKHFSVAVAASRYEQMWRRAAKRNSLQG